MENFTVSEIIKKFNLKVLYFHPKVNLDERQITNLGVNRGGLELTGFKTKRVSRTRRVMLLSSKESEYIASLDAKDYEQHFFNILEKHIPAIFVTPNFKYTKELCQIAKKLESQVPIIDFPSATSDFSNTAAIYIAERLSQTERVHGTLVNIYGYGVLITGESGIGKSETTLDLIRNGNLFVGDDSIDILKVNNKIIGKPNEMVKNLIEVRGIGILDVTKMYGYHIIMHETQINLVIKLIKLESKGWSKIDRIGSKTEYTEYFSIKIPTITIPVSPGRNLADLIEAAVISLKLKVEGQDAGSAFEQQVINKLKNDK